MIVSAFCGFWAAIFFDEGVFGFRFLGFYESDLLSFFGQACMTLLIAPWCNFTVFTLNGRSQRTPLLVPVYITLETNKQMVVALWVEAEHP